MAAAEDNIPVVRTMQNNQSSFSRRNLCKLTCCDLVPGSVSFNLMVGFHQVGSGQSSGWEFSHPQGSIEKLQSASLFDVLFQLDH